MENVVINSNEILSIFAKVERCKETNLKRIGETLIMNCGEIAFIVEYNSYVDITVQFKTTGELVKSTYQQFQNGNVKSHFTASVFGVGITGLEVKVDKNNKQLDTYSCWSGILQRCYSTKYQEKNPTYIGCSVAKEWLHYSEFKKYYDENYYSIEGQRMEIDKDILFKGNKVYSPKMCVFVPHSINSLFTKRQNNRGELPLGVTFHKITGKYAAQCRTGNGKQNLGLYNTPGKAYNVYKAFKENLIKKIAEQYKKLIPNNLYIAMLNYKVEILD